ncbi:hypothetical protein QJQ45_018343 [Haematococcus lacustris]|nr:hypothetical protein QJQ45_018343 [Haematococcus lacustris]
MSQQFAMGRGTQLLDLPEELLGAVLRQLPDGDSRLQVCRSSKRLATALLQHTPAIQLTYPLAADHSGGTGEERRIATFLARALSARQAQLHLTLQPEGRLLAQLSKKETSRVLTSTLGAVELCSAVTHLTVEFPEDVEFPPCQWKPLYSAGLAASYPSLTSLTLVNITLTTTQLGQLLSHPLLLPRLQHLDMTQGNITDKKRSGTSPFIGSRLQRLSLGSDNWIFTPHLSPLAAHLTRLDLHSYMDIPATSLAAALGALTALQWLYLDLTDGDRTAWACFPALAQLPSLHTLQLKYTTVGPDQLDALLALTQVTRLQLHQISDLTSSWANAACSWKQLTVRFMDWVTVAHLPLHSLTHPLQFNALIKTGAVQCSAVQCSAVQCSAVLTQPSVLSRPRDGDSRLQVWRSCKRLATTLLQHAPAIQLTYPLAADHGGGTGEERRIATFLAEALLTRKAQLHLTLQPEGQLLAQLVEHEEGRVLVSTLGAVELCPAVTHLTIRFSFDARSPPSFWKPLYSAGLAASYPSLTSLTLVMITLTTTQLGQLLSHPLLLPRLKHLNLGMVYIADETQPGTSPFSGSRLQRLYLRCDDWIFPTRLAPLGPHLTRLDLYGYEYTATRSLAAALGALTALQWLYLLSNSRETAWACFPTLAQLPSLHTLQLVHTTVDQEQLDALLALTQVTSLELQDITALTSSRANAACSWRQLKLYSLDLESAAHLPLHSLTYPLQFDFVIGEYHVTAEMLAAAEVNLWERNKAGLVFKGRRLSRGIDKLAKLAALAASFPSLKSLAFQKGRLSKGNLATAIKYPLLSPRLRHLDLVGISIAHEGQLGRSPFIGSRLKELRIDVDGHRGPLPGLMPLPPTLTQLEVTDLLNLGQWDWVGMAAAVSSLTQLQGFKLTGKFSYSRSGPLPLLRALAHLPSLHTLVMEDVLAGQEQLDVLLEATQITRLQLNGFSGLTCSRASADCSWRQLQVWRLDWDSAAYLPLHSLTHPLHLHALESDSEEPSVEVLAAAELNLCESNKAGLVLDDELYLSKTIVDLLTKEYLSHNGRTAQQPPHPIVASSSHSGGLGSSSGQGAIVVGLPHIGMILVEKREVRFDPALRIRARPDIRGFEFDGTVETDGVTLSDTQQAMNKPLLLAGTQLLDLPDELLGAVLRQLRDGESRLHVFRTSKRLAIALLQHTPAIELKYPLGADGYEDSEENGTCLTAFEYSTQRLAPFLTHALLARKAALQLSLQPAEGLLTRLEDCYETDEDSEAVHAVAAKLASYTLGILELCPAVTHLTVKFNVRFGCFWQPGHTAALAAAYPSLTSLTLKDFMTTFTQLSKLVRHPVLLSQLQRLDISDLYMCGWDDSKAGEPRNSPFTGLRLKQLSLGVGYGGNWPHLAPLAPHLTQLAAVGLEPESLATALRSLTNLQHLWLYMDGKQASLRTVLPALAQLPSLHTLELPRNDVGQEALDQLLALTQVTFLRVRRFKNIALSRTTAACSWRQLELCQRGWELDWATAAHLPLHSLTHPLQVSQLGGSVEVGAEVLAAAELNLCERNKAGLEVEDMVLSRATVDLLTELYLSHCHLASSSHSRPSTSSSLPSTSPEGHMPAGEAGSSGGLGVQQGAAAGGQALLQRLGPYVNKVTITLPVSTDLVNLGRPLLSPANLHALAALSTKKGVAFKSQHM